MSPGSAVGVNRNATPDEPNLNSATAQAPPPRLLDRLRDATRVRHYSIRTEDAYADWARRFILFNDKRHPLDLGAPEVAAFLSHLAVDRQVAASTQNQAKSALLFLYKAVLGIDLPWLDEIIGAKTPRRLPVVLTPSQVRSLLHELNGTMGYAFFDIGGESQSPGRNILADQRLQSRLVDRNATATHLRNLLFVNVQADHVVAQIGETGSRHQTHITAADNGNFHYCASATAISRLIRSSIANGSAARVTDLPMTR